VRFWYLLFLIFQTFKNYSILIYSWLCWVFMAVCAGFLCLWGATLHCGVWDSHCSGFSADTGSRCTCSVVAARGLSSCCSQALGCGPSSCGAGAQLLQGTWNLPRPGAEVGSGGVLTHKINSWHLNNVGLEGMTLEAVENSHYSL